MSDLHSLFETDDQPEGTVVNPFAEFEDQADPFVPTRTNLIYREIAKEIDAREKDTNIARASSTNYCSKRLHFIKNGAKGIPLTPRKIEMFAIGDKVEEQVQERLKKSLLGTVYSELDFGVPVIYQAEIPEGLTEFQKSKLPPTITKYYQPDTRCITDGLEIKCHQDGWGKRISDGKWELIEIKSAGDYGFNEFKKNEMTNYLPQAMVNLRTDKAKQLGANEVAFYYVNKNTGHYWDRLYSFDQKYFNLAITRLRIGLSNEIPAPEYPLVDEKVYNRRTKEYDPTGRKIAGFPCAGYCPFVESCHGPHEKQWSKNQFGNFKPKLIFNK